MRLIQTKQLTEQTGTWDIHEIKAAKRGHLGKISLCLFWQKDKGMPKEISQEAGSKNKFGFLLICTAAQFRMLWKPVTLHDCKWKKKWSKFMEKKIIILSTQSYYSSTTPDSGSFPLQNSGTVFWEDIAIYLPWSLTAINGEKTIN